MRSRSSLFLSMGAIIAVLAACAGKRGESVAPVACEPVPERFVAAGGPVFPACAVDRAAAVMPNSRIVMQMQSRPAQQCGRVIVEFVVDATGQPVRTSARLVQSNDGHFAEAVLAGLATLRYRPAMKDGQPVQQLVRYEQTYVAIMATSTTPASSARAQRPRC